jgi:D-alanyl-D-alanine carboxypeptidase (penicillin-binding protein 5/6)
MGGSQVFLKEGEGMSVEEMLKCVIIASANDCAVALAEHVAGSEESFVSAMNARAAELGMANTHFENTNGLDDTAKNHLTSARDIAIMTRELLKYEDVFKYTTIWMDSLRNGEFGLSNTNKLIRFYQGATGLKTGSTDAARYCISATAERDGMELVAVIMKGNTSNERFEDAQTLLTHGFSNYTLKKILPEMPLAPVPVVLGTQATCQPVLGDGNVLLLEKTAAGELKQTVEILPELMAPVAAGDHLGTLTVSSGEEELARIPIVAGETVDRLTFPQVFGKLLKMALMAA